MAKTCSRDSSSISSIVPNAKIPALLTRISTVPKVSMQVFTMALNSLDFETSAFIAIAFDPRFSISDTTFRAFFSDFE